MTKESVPIVRKQSCIGGAKPVSYNAIDAATAVRISSVVCSIQENTVDEHTQTYTLDLIGSSGNLAALSNPVVESDAIGRALPRQPPNNL